MRPAQSRALAKILGVLGSAHDSEILAAARQAHRHGQGGGVDMGKVLTPSQNDVAVAAAELLLTENQQLRAEIERLKAFPPWQDPDDLNEARVLCDLWCHRLSDWEQRFVISIADRTRLSQKQVAVVLDIVAKISRLAQSAT